VLPGLKLSVTSWRSVNLVMFFLHCENGDISILIKDILLIDVQNHSFILQRPNKMMDWTNGLWRTYYLGAAYWFCSGPKWEASSRSPPVAWYWLKEPVHFQQ
jgi:hypothetical protein